MEEVARRSAAMLAAIDRFSREHWGLPPTLIEVGNMIGVQHKSQLWAARNRLADQGLVRYVAKSARSMQVTDQGKEVLKLAAMIQESRPANGRKAKQAEA
jgi:RIO-like serine/threonine protein kinase